MSQHLLLLVPSKITDFSFQDYVAYTVGGKVVGLPVTALLADAVGVIIFVLVSVRAFKTHQVNR